MNYCKCDSVSALFSAHNMNLSRFIISYINDTPAKGIIAISLDLFWVINNIIRNTLGKFMWKCRWKIRLRKM